MRKIIFKSIIIIFFIFFVLITILSTIGIETNKFNNLIINKASKDRNIKLNLDTIKFKIDLKKMGLFLETKNPEITFRDAFLPVNNLKVYIDFLSLIKSDPKINEISINLKEIDITEFNKLSSIIKPSNFKSILSNNIKRGKLISEIIIFLSKDGNFKNFIAKGSVKNLEAQLGGQLYLKETRLSFFADKSDILIKNIFGSLNEIKISDGDIKINLEDGVKLSSNFKSFLNLDDEQITKYLKFLDNSNLIKNLKNIKAELTNNFKIDFDSTYKVRNYDYSVTGEVEKSELKLLKPFKNNFVTEEIKTIYLSDLKINSNFKPNKINFNAKGKYSFNNLDFLKINFLNNFDKDLINLKLNIDYRNSFVLDLLNYKKSKDSIANLYLDLDKKKDQIEIKNLNFEEGKKSIEISGLKLNKNKFSSFKEIKVATSNNDFTILNGKKIMIKGNKFDATNLAKFFNKKDSKNELKELNNNIEIEFTEVIAPLSEKIKNFRLIGEIQEGKFVKISSKGDFGGGNFLDISMKKDKNTNKKYLEIYSDLTRPLLTEYSFFKGLSGGKLFFTSIIEDSKSNSKLKIENFKVANAPGVLKLLSLADLGGLADLVEGEGLSFDVLEIDMEKNKNFLKINEIIALGPSMSVLMEGYQDVNGLTSLRGTLVPAKTLNKMISKIPVIGDIVIPREIGEGLFGISFKMKGPKGDIKTTINPIKSLTPRFIQKIIERNKD